MKTSWFYLRSMLMICLLAVGFASCSDDDDDAPSVIKFNAPKEVSALAQATSVELSFTAPAEWKAEASSGWFSLNKTTGMAGEHSLVVNIIENKDVTDREGTITLTMGTAEPITIKVKQYGKNEELVFMKDEVELTINDDEQTITGSVNVLCNYDFQVSANADWLNPTVKEDTEAGDNRYTISFVADASKLKSFAKAEATLTASYQAATRALPADKSIKVVFPGITPTLKFYQKDAEGNVKNLNDYAHAILEQNEAEEYRIMVHVESNFKWALNKESIPEWMSVETMSATEDDLLANESADFFTNDEILFISFSSEDGKPSTDEALKAELAFAQNGLGNAAVENKLIVDYKGLSNYVQINFESLQQYWSGETANIMFPATGEELIKEGTSSWNPDVYGYAAEFTVTANIKNIAFIATEVSNNFEPLATNADYVTVKEVTAAATRALGKSTFKVMVNNRGEREWGTDPYKNRFFALFAVNADELEKDEYSDEGYSTDASQLFSHEGIPGSGNADILKEQYKNSYVTMGQWALKKVVTFDLMGVQFDWTEEVAYDGNWLEAPAKGGKATMQFTTNAKSMEETGFTIYYNVEGEEGGYDWTGKAQFDDEAGDKMGIVMSFDTDIEYNSWEKVGYGTVFFTIPANTTGVARTMVYGLVSGTTSEKGKDLLLHKFTVTQAAE